MKQHLGLLYKLIYKNFLPKDVVDTMADEESFKNALETTDSLKTCNVCHTRIIPPSNHLFVMPVQRNAQILFYTQHVNNLFYPFVVHVTLMNPKSLVQIYN